MTTLKSYDLNGKKLSFANWISNLSPQDTPFTSMTGKESVEQTLFQWQTDALSKAGENAQAEGTAAKDDLLRSTAIKQNLTQILRKVVKVSDTANALANYGRGKELQYQMEKAGQEIKRDLEHTFLNNSGSRKENAAAGIGRETAGFHGLVAAKMAACPETGAIVHARVSDFDKSPEGMASNALTEKALFTETYNLYLAGSHANVIMYHPKWASFFSSLQEKADGVRQRIFENTPKFSVYVSTLVDPLGQEYKLIPNRWMPNDKIYFFAADDWTQMVLRAPVRTKLAKDGSYEKWMIEMEVGLRHRHPFASGILEINTTEIGLVPEHNMLNAMTGVELDTATMHDDPGHAGVAMVGEALIFKGTPILLKPLVNGEEPEKKDYYVLKDGVVVWSKVDNNGADVEPIDAVIIPKLTKADAGIYTIEVTSRIPDTGERFTITSNAMVISVKDADGAEQPAVRGE